MTNAPDKKRKDAMKSTGSQSLLKASGGLAGCLILLGALIALNIIAGNLRLRLDLTQEKLYTLSDGTRKVLRSLEQPVTLKLFFNSSSAEVPVYLKNYARQVTDVLKEYRVAAKGNVALETYDPKPDSDEEDWARRYGITGRQTGMFEPPIYFGLVAVCGNQEAAIPVLDPSTEELLEYNVTRLVHRVTHPEKPVIGVLSSLPVLGMAAPRYPMPGQPPPQNRPPWLSFRELRDDYELRTISPETGEIDPDLDTLVLVHPKQLSDDTLYAIDQFVLRGGRLLAFLDPMSAADQESSPQAGFRMPQTASNLEPLLKAWGVGYDPAEVVVDERAITRITMPNRRVEDSPVFLTLRRDSINKDDVLTAKLESITTPFAGALKDETSQDLTFTPLVSSSDGAVMMNAFSAQFGREALRDIDKQARATRVIAARLAGKFKTAFPDGPPKEEDTDVEKDEEKKDEAKDEEPEEDKPAGFTEGTSSVIVVADVDMLYDRFCVQQLDFFGTAVHTPMNDNLNFLANAIEQMAGGAALSSVRSRGRFGRPFDRVLALEQKARDEWQARENDLTKRLQETRSKLRELQGQKAQHQRFILIREQKEAIEQFQADERRMGKELKEVRKNLRRDIERLGMRVKVINIALMPVIVGLVGIGFAVRRRFK